MKYKNEEKYRLAMDEYINDTTTTIKYLAMKYNFDQACFGRFLKKQNIKIRNTSSKENNDKYKRAEELYKNGNSILSISKELNINRKNLGIYLKDKGLNLNTKSNRYQYDKHFFEKINTEEKAYWLGFIYADGCVTNNTTRSLRIELATIDEQHLCKFKNSIQSNNTIYYRQNRNTCCLTICNKHLVESLENLGCVQNKTHVGSFDFCLDKNLAPHFIRGFLDGDGYIDKKRNRIVFVIKSLLITTQLHEMILNTTDIDFKIRQDNNYYRLYVENKKDCNTFLNCIYNNATIYLDRKYEIYKNKIMPS